MSTQRARDDNRLVSVLCSGLPLTASSDGPGLPPPGPSSFWRAALGRAWHDPRPSLPPGRHARSAIARPSRPRLRRTRPRLPPRRAAGLRRALLPGAAGRRAGAHRTQRQRQVESAAADGRPDAARGGHARLGPHARARGSHSTPRAPPLHRPPRRGEAGAHRGGDVGLLGRHARRQRGRARARALRPCRAGRLALARLVASPAALWLLDEPLTGLDSDAVADLAAAIAAHRAQGGLVVLSTHAALPLESAETLSLTDFAARAAA